MNEVLSVWKPKEISSYDIIREFKKYYENIKIGHCGTLDPFAEGVIIVCLGDSVKDSNKYMNLKKDYTAVIKLGKETDTLDLTGSVIKSNKTPKLTYDKIDEVINSFKGSILQIPPYYSAKKIFGIKLYKLARKSIFIRKKPVKVNIYDISLNSFNDNSITISIKCGKGTYIRSLGRDIGYKLGSYAYLEKLERTKVGDFNFNNSIEFKDIKNAFSS